MPKYIHLTHEGILDLETNLLNHIRDVEHRDCEIL